MIKAFIVDDQEVNTAVIKNLLKKFFPRITITAISTSATEAILLVKELQPELLFLDIHMPELNGLEFIQQIDDQEIEVIFVTAFSEYALEAFENQATGYITKPVSAEKFVLTVNKALEHILNKKKLFQLEKKTVLTETSNLEKLILSTQKGLIFIHPDKVYYCESNGNYTTFFLQENKQVVVSKQIGQFEMLLPKQHFVRIHDRYIINLKHIKTYQRGNGGFVILENDKELPVSIRRKENLLRYFNT